jgi:glycosyltransferase involved in cell wall biosynthesis
VRDGVDGYVVPIRNVQAIVEKLEHLRVNPDERIQMGRNARERALTFTWAQYQKRVLNHLDVLRSSPETAAISVGRTRC